MKDLHYIYLDNAATTPMDPEVIKVICKQFKTNYGNASSLHSLGQKATKVMERSRGKIANLINSDKDDIFFVSSGTEADNLAIKGVAYKNKKRGNHIITSKIEHHAVLHPCEELEKQGFNVTYLPVDRNGLIDLKELEDSITKNTILISVMFANNEIGTIQPIKKIGKIAKKHDILFHTDAVQAFGKIPIDVDEMNIDLLSVSGHKIYGPKGIGLLYIRNGGRKKGQGRFIKPLMEGGGHERKIRPSTEAVPLIAGFAKAAELAENKMEEEAKRLKSLRDKIIDTVLNNIEDSYLNGHPSRRLPNNVNVGFKYIEGESMVLSLDMEGIETSTGSACSSKELKASHVLLAIGLETEEAHGSLRITLGRFTSEEDVDFFLEKLPPVIERLRKMSPLKKEV
ncbi:MAG: cysteine desulfurase NifS [Promethearchaeia archaeon]